LPTNYDTLTFLADASPHSPIETPEPHMPLVAKASNTVRNKNLLIVLMCLGFFVMFLYDGFIGYPRTNDLGVEKLKQMFAEGKIKAKDPEEMDRWQAALSNWRGWNNATGAQREQMHEIATKGSTVAGGVENWKRPFDIELQRYIVYGLAAAVIASLWWFIHCQQRRAIADDTTVSPAKNVVIPWDKITVIDNTRWKKSGIVEITYLDDAGNPQKAKFDDYELDREPLLGILDMLAEKARNAEFIPKEEPAA
jgi:hypothetical protein